MKITAINIKTEKKVKEQARKVVEELGLSLSAYVNASLKQLIRTREMHFSTGYVMTPHLERLIEQAEREYKKGNYAGPFATVEDMDGHLDSL